MMSDTITKRLIIPHEQSQNAIMNRVYDSGEQIANYNHNNGGETNESAKE